ncbi:MAG TPA: tetratricopeptide repeat protein [Thermoanaerobaculia bacterium]|nr:tetratricopeptide repeat protein [Thermoanaerobaculia bacterium]
MELRRRWEDEPGSPIFLQLAEEYRRVGRTTEALEVLETGLDKSPGYLSARVALGRILLELARPADSLTQLKAVLERDPAHMVASKLMVEAHLQRHDPVLARRQLDHYAQLSPSDPDLETLRARIDNELLAPAEEVPVAVTPEAAPEPPPTPARKTWRATDEAEPFAARPPGLDRSTYRSRLGTDGLFTAPPPPVAPESFDEPAPTALPPEDAWSALVTEPTAPAAEAAAPAVEVAEPELEDDTAVLPAPEPMPAPPGPEPATVTLADLYLRQGHLEEAGRIYLRVLEKEPSNSQALAGLKEVADQLAPPPTAQPVPEATTVAAGSDASLHERKVALYRRYLHNLQARRAAHAP